MGNKTLAHHTSSPAGYGPEAFNLTILYKNLNDLKYKIQTEKLRCRRSELIQYSCRSGFTNSKISTVLMKHSKYTVTVSSRFIFLFPLVCLSAKDRGANSIEPGPCLGSTLLDFVWSGARSAKLHVKHDATVPTAKANLLVY